MVEIQHENRLIKVHILHTEAKRLPALLYELLLLTCSCASADATVTLTYDKTVIVVGYVPTTEFLRTNMLVQSR